MKIFLRIIILKIRACRHYVFKVHAYSPCVNDLRDGSFQGCNVGGKAGLNIGSDGRFDGATDASDSVKHLRPGRNCPSGKPRALAMAALLVAIAGKPQCSIMAALAASHALMRMSGCAA